MNDTLSFHLCSEYLDILVFRLFLTPRILNRIFLKCLLFKGNCFYRLTVQDLYIYYFVDSLISISTVIAWIILIVRAVE